MNRYQQIFGNTKSVIGMIAFESIDSAIEHALADLAALQEGGVDGVCLENDFDRPHQLIAGPEVVASFTRIAQEVAVHAKVPVGIQVLLNDWRASLAIAKVIGAQFVRLDFFVDRVRIAAGVIEPQPPAVIAYRKQIKAENVALFTDIQVKYSEMLEVGKTISASAQQAVVQGSDAVIVTGRISGDPPTISDLKEARETLQDFPLLVGSGTTPQNIADLFLYADGAIVGTALKNSDGPHERIVPHRVRNLMDAFHNMK